MSAGLEIVIPDCYLETRVEEALARILERRRWAEIDGVADYIGCPLSRVRYLRSIGMPARKVGRRLLFDLLEVDAFLERLEQV